MWFRHHFFAFFTRCKKTRDTAHTLTTGGGERTPMRRISSRCEEKERQRMKRRLDQVAGEERWREGG
jgi:hypothetical protein